ncbi:DUF3142 domain-containing protein [Oxalobacteraceae bacterium CAVE-383]|nr:DUF3142 domain-containing protein [Oxalobacteraceae bacterium CAVE-383]
MPPLLLLLLLPALAFLTACSPTSTVSAPLTQDAYIWQRRWTPAVPQAMQASGDLVRTWRVLAAESDDADADRWTDVAPDWTALAAAKRPAIMVMRIDGQFAEQQETAMQAATIAHALALVKRWQQAGVRIAGLEIDHDCATARLPAYARLLTALRRQLDPAISLSITALPTWLDSPALDGLLAAADEAVLQVHAVLNPRQGLFDARLAHAWLSEFAKHTQHPWRVALPTYGTRVTWDANGRIAGIESERPMPAPAGPNVAAELVAQPETMAAFVSQIERDRPRGLAGLVWFRLPTTDDARAWSLPTWRAILARQPLTAGLEVLARAPRPQLQSAAGSRTDAGLRDVMLVNSGGTDAALPSSVRLDARCRTADGINGYVLETDAQGMYLRRTRDGLLRAGRQRNIGWLVCPQENIAFHVQS